MINHTKLNWSEKSSLNFKNEKTLYKKLYSLFFLTCIMIVVVSLIIYNKSLLKIGMDLLTYMKTINHELS